MDIQLTKYKEPIEQQRRRDALKQALQAALRRLSEDEFGYFMECGGEIEEVRL